MASGNLNAPHPLLTTSTLYVSDVVQELEWSHLMEVFKPCGFVRSGGKSTTSGGRTRWMVIFTDLFHAEMALATLQGALIPDILPPFHLTLSHTSMLGSSLPNERILPQFAKGTPKAHSILSSVSPQTIFTWFRPAGPLVSVRVRVDLGFAYRTCTLEYWDENYARYARIHSRVLHPALADLKPFDLHTYDPTTLTCTGFGTLWRQPDLYETFSKLGNPLDIRMIKVAVPDAFGMVSYPTADEAEKALHAVNGKIVGTKRLTVRYYEPDQQDTFRPAFFSRSPRSDSGYSWRQKTPHMSTSSMPRNTDIPKHSEYHNEASSDNLESNGVYEDRSDGHNDERDSPGATQRRVDEADAAERLARLQQESAKIEEQVAQIALSEATRIYENYRVQQAEADLAVEKAERILLEAKERQLQSIHRVIQSLEKKNETSKQEQDASRRHRDAIRNTALKRMLAEEARGDSRKTHPSAGNASQPKQEPRGATNGPGKSEPEWRSQKRRESMKENGGPSAGEAFGRRGRWGFQQDDSDAGWRRKSEADAEKGDSREPPEETAAETDRGADEARRERERRAEAEADERRTQERVREEEEAKMQEEVERRNAVEESIRKMKIMQEQEEQERREKERKKELNEQRRKDAETLATEARERQAREEEERREREIRERSEQESQRQKQYEDAAAKEKSRCQARDETRWNIRQNSRLSPSWTAQQSISRFQAISVEFETIKFSESQPLTFASVPWPLLHYPPLLTFENIEWGAVEEFFAAMRTVVTESEYKSIVEKAHRRFHPDKWRSRGVLSTVLDEELRSGLEKAGNRVAQALTPLWLASKSK